MPPDSRNQAPSSPASLLRGQWATSAVAIAALLLSLQAHHRLRAVVRPDGTLVGRHLLLRGATGPAVVGGTDDRGHTGLAVVGDDGQPRIELYTDAGDGARVLLRSSSDRSGVLLQQLPGAGAGLTFYGPGGNKMVAIWTNSKEGSALEISREGQSPSVVYRVTPDGKGKVELSAKTSGKRGE